MELVGVELCALGIVTMEHMCAAYGACWAANKALILNHVDTCRVILAISSLSFNQGKGVWPYSTYIDTILYLEL